MSTNWTDNGTTDLILTEPRILTLHFNHKKTCSPTVSSPLAVERNSLMLLGQQMMMMMLMMFIIIIRV
jgi:hypothetical protein